VGRLFKRGGEHSMEDVKRQMNWRRAANNSVFKVGRNNNQHSWRGGGEGGAWGRLKTQRKKGSPKVVKLAGFEKGGTKKKRRHFV